MSGEIQVNLVDKEIVRVNLIEQETITVIISSASGGIVSNPPADHYRVTNIWVNKNTGKVHVDYEQP
jgi:hypothetical protein